MINESQKAASALEKALSELEQLRQFAGPPDDFWGRFMGAAQQLSLADKLVLLARKPGQPWRRLLEWPAMSPPSRMLTTFFSRLEVFASDAFKAGGLLTPLEPGTRVATGNFMIAARLELPEQEECLLAGLVSEAGEASAREAWLRLRLACETPQLYQANLAGNRARADVEKFASVLDLAFSVSAENRFVATAMAFCNSLATRFNCERVSLGWLEAGYVRLRAISRTEKFDRRMAAAQALEVAMEECLDQDDEIVWPATTGATVISRDHEKFAKAHQAPHLCSLPLRAKSGAVAVVTCERQAAPFSETEVQQMRLGCDLAAVRLIDLRQQDRWFGARWAGQLREQCAKWLGPEHTWAKLLAIGVVLLLAALFLVRLPYRVTGNFVLRSDDLSYLTAPFDGYIDQVLVRPGDAIAAGAPLLKLKTSELQLEESFTAADLIRYQREAEKARAAKERAEMLIAEAMAEQTEARLELVRYRLAHATIASPFAGVVVEGDLRERLGAPVKAADVLFKVARIDTLYVEADVNERDIHELRDQASGQVAFVSRPKEKFPIQIRTIEKAAVPKNEANVFLVRCAAPTPESWWRPGMSGVCKFNAGKRSLFWLLTHRTVDFLRLKLWW